jgi:RNA polymerase subunit RPABC4/transcription elongation factor Spt4
MHCQKCKASVDSGWQFCPKCGSKVKQLSAEEKALIITSVVKVANVVEDWRAIYQPVLNAVGIPMKEVEAAISEDGRIATSRGHSETALVTRQYDPAGVRAKILEVIVRQALAGVAWREVCAGPMQVNGITPEEVEAEVKRRKELASKSSLLSLDIKDLPTKIAKALKRPFNLEETLMWTLKKDLELRKQILNTIAQYAILGKDWEDEFAAWIRVYEITAIELEKEIEAGAKLKTPPSLSSHLVGIRANLVKLLSGDDPQTAASVNRALGQLDILVGVLLEDSSATPTKAIKEANGKPKSTRKKARR